MSVKRISILLLLLQLSCYFGSGSCGKVLVWPVDYSHWMNMKIILDALVQRGHEVTVLRSSASIVINANNESGIKFETFPTSPTKDEMETFAMYWINQLLYKVSLDRYWEHFPVMENFILKLSDIDENICKDVVLNKKLMAKLQESRFDVVLADPVNPGGELLAELLKIPLVYTLRYFPGYLLQKHGGGLLLPASYVPVIMSGLSSQMTFTERVKNMICVLYFDFWFPKFNEKRWNQFYSEVLGRPIKLLELMGKADMWLIRSYWDLEFPRPLLPNFDFVGGLHCKPAKPLPKEMEDFVQSSGEEGVVVFSLGSMVSNMTEERANVIASALAQLPQKRTRNYFKSSIANINGTLVDYAPIYEDGLGILSVPYVDSWMEMIYLATAAIWRFEGKKPGMLGSNTRLYKWIPQNDLLGHPKTKAFITHGGANGVFEAIYHGVPMVGIPLFGDQLDNIVYMKAKGAAVKLDWKTMSSADLLNALKTVINDPSYKEHVMTLSRIHHDQPMKPLDRAVFWTEYVMRHKGAKHLRVAAHDLTWFQYHSLDVIGFLLACVTITTYLVMKCCLLVYQNVVIGKKKKGD